MGATIRVELNKGKLKEIERSSKENIRQSLGEIISWRTVGTITTVAVSYIITGTMALVFYIRGIELVSKMELYFFNERTWNTIKWENDKY
ncbi:DUF2061 domain-containing protein [uncultured Winogradskyella sp.]|uniref:DUF2061 domain-containing protein n=1 Tax=uncultured Winogradskyella sp. TaxID=395353 RepID=UPI00261B8744|nr:DUF2061 domain-containing protein [uncultured Winogradskyella sp.]